MWVIKCRNGIEKCKNAARCALRQAKNGKQVNFYGILLGGGDFTISIKATSTHMI